MADQNKPTVPPTEPNKPTVPPVEPPKDPPTKPKLPDFSAEQKAYIKELRDENKSHRQKAESLEKKFDSLTEKLSALGGADNKATPEQKLEILTKQNQEYQAQFEALQAQQEVAAFCAEKGIPADKTKYFNFLLNEAAEKVPDGQELPDEVLDRIVQEVKGVSNATKPANSTVSDKDGNQNAKGGGQEDNTTYEAFLGMNLGEKDKFYKRNAELYQTYYDKARAANEIR